jgi:hypothetical protein
MSGQFKQKKVAFSLKHVANHLITKPQLESVAKDFMEGTTGDPIADKVINEYLATGKWDLIALKVFVKRVYYLGLMEGARRVNSDPRVRYVKGKKDAT